MKLTMHPATPERWPDLEALFMARGVGCPWLLVHVLPPQRIARTVPPGTTHAQANRLNSGTGRRRNPPGLIGYRGKVPVGCVARAARAIRQAQAPPVMKAVDDQPVWSIICFVVPAQYRDQGVARALPTAPRLCEKARR
jgi:hypothetical protein